MAVKKGIESSVTEMNLFVKNGKLCLSAGMKYINQRPTTISSMFEK